MRTPVLVVALMMNACDAGPAARRTTRPKDAADTHESDVRAAILQRDPSLTRIEILGVDDAPDHFVAICDWEREWWGTFKCVRIRSGRVEFAQIDASQSSESAEAGPTEQSIHAVRGFVSGQFAGPLVEVWGKTHMGHGNYYLYCWEGNRLRILMKTFAVDYHHDATLIRGGRLDVSYADENGDEQLDVTFRGVVDEYDDGTMSQEAPIASHPCRKVFLWNSGAGRFVEDRSRRIGFELYPGRR